MSSAHPTAAAIHAEEMKLGPRPVKVRRKIIAAATNIAFSGDVEQYNIEHQATSAKLLTLDRTGQDPAWSATAYRDRLIRRLRAHAKKLNGYAIEDAEENEVFARVDVHKLSNLFIKNYTKSVKAPSFFADGVRLREWRSTS